MTVAYGGVHDSKTQIHEHVEVGDVGAKRVLMSGYDGVNINDIDVDSQGRIATLANLSPSGNTVISTYNDKFRDDFNTFDEVNNWTVKQLGTGQSYELRGVAGGARFLAINSGTTSGAETILLCKKSFQVPFKVAFGVSVTLSSDTSGIVTGKQIGRAHV